MQVCNKGLRLMLAGDDEGALIDFREELSSYGQYFSDSGNMKGATFIYVLYKLTEHVLPPEATGLEVCASMERRALLVLECGALPTPVGVGTCMPMHVHSVCKLHANCM